MALFPSIYRRRAPEMHAYARLPLHAMPDDAGGGAFYQMNLPRVREPPSFGPSI